MEKHITKEVGHLQIPFAVVVEMIRFIALDDFDVFTVYSDQKCEHELHELNDQALVEKVPDINLAEVITPLIFHGYTEECA